MGVEKKETSDDYRILNHNYHNHDNIIVLSHPPTPVVQLCLQLNNHQRKLLVPLFSDFMEGVSMTILIGDNSKYFKF